MATPTNLPASFVDNTSLPAATLNNLRGAFRVLQVVSSSDITTRTTSSDYPQVSSFNVSITPQSTSSLILISATLSCFIDSTGGNTNRIAVYGLSYGAGSTTPIYSTRWSAILGVGADMFTSTAMQVIHSPATTSACVYNVLFGRYNATYNNGVGINGNATPIANGRSTITAMEISA